MPHRLDSLWPLGERPASRWEYQPFDEGVAERLRVDGGYSPLMSRLFAARGFSEVEAIEDFKAPTLAGIHDPFEMKDMGVAVDRIKAAIDKAEPIVVYGDYDVDGVTSTAILKCAFAFLGVEVATYIPHRLKEGYGLSEGAVRRLAERGIKLIITVDNGTTAIDEVKLAAEFGIDVIVTDHHEPGETLPDAVAIVNPKQRDCAYPFKELCGAGVAFKLAHAMLKGLGSEPEASKAFLKSLLDFVALGTVADIVSLRGENRCFVAHGLGQMRGLGRLGIRCLAEVIGLSAQDISASKLGFTMAPRINAAGRTEHAELALELLLADDPTRARELAGMLDRFNDNRRRIEGDITEEAFSLVDEQSEDPVVVVGQDGWHHGVVGIVASRILERYHRPVIVLSKDGEWAKGSARSIRGFDMHAALEACHDHLAQYGGHTMAAGLRLRTTAIEAFRRALDAHARTVLERDQLIPTLRIDARATEEDLTADNIEQIEALMPFGAGNPKPLLSVEGLNLVEEPQLIKSRHMKLHLAGPKGTDIWAIGFSMGERYDELRHRHKRLRLAATPFINTWGGRRRMELEFKDFVTED